MIHGRQIACPLLLMLFASASPAATHDRGDWNNLGELRPGDTIHVNQSDRKAVRGTYRRMSDSELVVATEAGDVKIDRGNVARVSKSRPLRRIGNAAAIGLIAGTVAAGANRFGIACAETNDGCRNAAITTIAATAVGAAVGAFIPTSKVIYRRP